MIFERSLYMDDKQMNWKEVRVDMDIYRSDWLEKNRPFRRDSMFALESMKLFTQCRCRPATSFSRPATDSRRLMSDFLVAATPSLHINKWSFSHKLRFLRHSNDKIVYHKASELLFLPYQRLGALPSSFPNILLQLSICNYQISLVGK